MKPFTSHLALAAFAGLLLFASCTDEHAAIDANANSLAVVFAPELAGHTVASRAIDQTWSAGDLIGICRVAHEGTLLTGSAFGKYKISGDAGTLVSLVPNTTDQTIYYPVNGDKVNFIAFSPYGTTTTVSDNAVQYTTFADQATQAKMEAVDFLYHKGTTAYDRTATTPVSLTFRHVLSKVTINVTTTTGADKVDLSALIFTFAGTPGSVTAALADGTLTAGSTAATITPYHKPFSTGDVTRTATAIVVPNKNVAGRVITFTVAGAGGADDLVFTYTLPPSRAFDSGYAYTLNFTLTTDGIDVGTSSTEVWEEGTVNWEGKYMLDAPTELPLAWYPESKILAFSTNYTDEDGNDIEVVLSTSATDAAAGQPTWITLGESPLTATDKTTYTAYAYAFATKMNESTTDTRTAYAHIICGTATLKVVKLEQQECPVPEAASNCYILSPGDKIYIPVSRANEHTTLVGAINPAIDTDTEFTAELLWADTEDLLATAPTVCVTGSDGVILVEASSATIVGDGGNAVVAVKVDGEIVWSWHIWVCADTPTTYNGWMDRSLGALNNSYPTSTTDVSSLGLYYQSGRKDPFPKTTTLVTSSGSDPNWWNHADNISENSDVSYTVANPKTFVTENDKDWRNTTTYDPCPSGYHVPASSHWMASGWNASMSDYSQYNTSYGGYYPAAGYRDGNTGSITGAGTHGYYWSVTVAPIVDLQHLHFNSAEVCIQGRYSRSCGFSVRCIAYP